MRRLYLKILLYVVALVVVAQATTWILYYALRRARGPGVLRRNVVSIARYISAELEQAGGAGPAALAARATELGNGMEMRITLRDITGKIIAQSGAPLPDAPPNESGNPSVEVTQVEGSRVIIATIPQERGSTLRIAPLAKAYERSMLQPTLLLVCEGVLIGLLVIPLVRIITRPLRKLSETAKAIAGGDISRRAEVKGKDEIGDLARTFNQMADRIVTSLRQEKDLVTAVSHEVRAPLSRIRVASELLADSPEMPESARKHLTSITDEVEELDRLIEELLTRARLESAGFEFTPERFELVPVVRNAVKHAGDSAGERVQISAPVNPVLLRGSSALLGRAIRNVVENALQYSGPESQVVVSIDANATDARVVVEDQGIGIPPGEVERIFDPFFRGERSRSRRTGGVGFGLTLARDIVRRHQGDIAVESTPGTGTRVVIRVPYA